MVIEAMAFGWLPNNRMNQTKPADVIRRAAFAGYPKRYVVQAPNESDEVVADWHLEHLHREFAKRGWQIKKVHDGNGYDISSSWEIVRAGTTRFIDFNGLDDMRTLPVEESYGCQARGLENCQLYFRRRGSGQSNRRQLWESDLRHFIDTLDEADEEDAT